VINEAALLTAREHGTLINGAALEESVDRVVGGPRRKSKIISEQERKITAYHEGGHALAAWAMPTWSRSTSSRSCRAGAPAGTRWSSRRTTRA
jgi:ATP-dependent Zn protease